MKKAKIFYFSLQDQTTKDENLDWFERVRFEEIPFDRIAPDQKENWINLTDNDFDEFLPLVDKDVKTGRAQEAIFKLFSRGVATQRDEWVYDLSRDALIQKIKYLVEVYQERLKQGTRRELDIKWDRELTKYLERKILNIFEDSKIVESLYRPYKKQYFYFDKHFNGMTYQLPSIFPNQKNKHKDLVIVSSDVSARAGFNVLVVDAIPDLHLCATEDAFQCLPLYRYDKNGNRIENITDWGLTQFQTHYSDSTITKLDIFHYTYAVLHHPAYRQKYELNLKREFPRLPFYTDFPQWVQWGKTLMDLHLNYETIEPYKLIRKEIATKDKPKPKLKADKEKGQIILDENTQLENVPPLAWDYKLGNRSGLEWILDQYKEKKPKDPTIAKLFNTYRFADYKEQVIDLLQRVCTVSVETMEIILQMPDA